MFLSGLGKEKVKKTTKSLAGVFINFIVKDY